MKNKILFALSAATLLLTACGKSDFDAKWHYSKEDVANFEILNVSKSYSDNETTLKITSYDDIYKENIDITPKDIIVFDKNKVDENKGNEHYYSARSLNKGAVKYETIDFNEEDKNIIIKINDSSNTDYGVLINKSLLKNNVYAYGITQSGILGDTYENQTEFEEKYINSEPTWNEAKTIINIAGSLTTMFLAAGAGQMIVAISGLFSFMGNFGDIFALQVTPTISDVIKKLDVIDAELKSISTQIKANQEQLLDQFIKTQAQIDDVKLQIYDQNISLYNQGYVEPLDAKIRVYADYIEHSLATYTVGNKNIDVYYIKNNEGISEVQFINNPGIDTAKCSKYTYQLVFPQASEYLRTHANIVDENFIKIFKEDIKNSISNEHIFPNISKEQIIDDIYSTIIDEFVATRYKNEAMRENIVNYESMVINLANKLAGINSTSIIDSYVNRIKYMYNFAGESKQSILSTMASIRYNLDRYALQANTACYYAGINAKELGEAYEAAIKTIKDTTNAILELDDNYSYHMGINLNGNLYKTMWDISYTNPGNHPTFHAKLDTKMVTRMVSGSVSYRDADLTKVDILTQSDHTRILTRYNLLKANEITTSDTYFTYLRDNKVINEDTANAFLEMRKKNWIGKDAERILTSWEIVDMDNRYSNVNITCTEVGNPDGEYFKEGWKGKYMNTDNKREAKYWAGKMAQGTYIDLYTGNKINETKIACYATYSESHTLWIDDEYWGFVDNPYGNYYFVIGA